MTIRIWEQEEFIEDIMRESVSVTNCQVKEKRKFRFLSRYSCIIVVRMIVGETVNNRRQRVKINRVIGWAENKGEWQVKKVSNTATNVFVENGTRPLSLNGYPRIKNLMQNVCLSRENLICLMVMWHGEENGRGIMVGCSREIKGKGGFQRG